MNLVDNFDIIFDLKNKMSPALLCNVQKRSIQCNEKVKKFPNI